LLVLQFLSCCWWRCYVAEEIEDICQCQLTAFFGRPFLCPLFRLILVPEQVLVPLGISIHAAQRKPVSIQLVNWYMRAFQSFTVFNS
jgi:hypothetical protein